MLLLQVTGMTCDHCVRAVRHAVQAVPGADGVDVDLDSGAVRVTGTPAASAVRAAIEAEGYAVAADQSG
jgi:copper chaperone CopZ